MKILTSKSALCAVSIASCMSVLFVGSDTARASNQTGVVTKVAFAGPRFLFWVGGTRGSRPSCDCCNRWEIAVSDPNSQARMSLILTAYAQGKAIYVDGSGACVAGAGDTEGVGYFEVGS